MRHVRPLLFALALLAGAGCGAPPAPDPLAGDYLVKGGGAALDVFDALSAGFIKQHAKVHFTFEDVGSAAGMKLVANDEVDLATSSAQPAADIAPLVTVIAVGSSATAVVVNAQNKITNLTKSDVRDVFSGQKTDWSQVGGTPGKISLVIREASSALRSNFDAYFFDGKPAYPRDAIELNSADQIINALHTNPGLVSMLTVTAQVTGDSRLRMLSIDGVGPSKTNILAGTYPVRRPLFLVYNPKTAKPAIKAFADYVKGAEGQKIIEQVSTGG